MLYSLRSVDVNEMWGPPDTIERIQYKGKDLDFCYKFICKEYADYDKAYWFIDQLNLAKTPLKELPKKLNQLEKKYSKIKDQYEEEKRKERHKKMWGEVSSTKCTDKVLSFSVFKKPKRKKISKYL